MIKVQLHLDRYPDMCFTMFCEYSELKKPALFSFYDWFDENELTEGPRPSDCQLRLFKND